MSNLTKSLKITGCLILVLFSCSWAYAASVGDIAPLFTLPTLHTSVRDTGVLAGDTVSLKDLRGKVVFVNFWASWCGPCRKELPELDKLRRQYQKNGLVILAINIDKSKKKALSFLEKQPNKLSILLDPKKKVASLFKVRGMPSSFVLDSRGIIRYIHLGYSEKDTTKWRKEVETLLKEVKPKKEGKEDK